MPSPLYSSFTDLDHTLRDLCGENLNACRSGGLLRKLSLTHGSTEVQSKNPFVDEYALRDSGYDQDGISTMQRDVRTTMIHGSVGLPVSDDGLPNSVPSRHTRSANSLRPINRHVHAAPFSAGSRHRPPPLPLSPRSATSQRTLSNPFQVSIPGHGVDLVTPRASPQRQTMFVDATVGDRSETACINSAGEPAQIIRESQCSAGAPKTLSMKIPNAYAARTRTRSSVSGQKQPFPLLSPVLAQASERRTLNEKENQNHERSKHGTQIIKQRTCLPTDICRSKSNRIDQSLKVVFVICIITLTAAVVTGVKDAKVHLLEASTVIAGIIGFVGSAASVLCVWAISIGCRHHKDMKEVHPEEHANQEEADSVRNEKQDRASQYSKEMQPKLVRLGMTSGKGKQRTEDVERSPRFKLKSPMHLPPFASPLQGQHPLNGAQANKFGFHLSIPHTAHSSLSGIPPPSSNALPAPSSRRHSAPSSRSEADKNYRELLELRLASRDIWEVLDEAAQVDEAAEIDEIYEEQQSPDSGLRNEPQRHIACEITARSAPARRDGSQTLHTTNNGTVTQQPTIPAVTRSPSSIPSVFLRTTTRSPQHHTHSPLDKSTPSFSSYPPLSRTSSSETSIDQISATSLAHPSPVYQRSDTEKSADSVAYSDTSALRELRTMRSVQKVRLWQKFMLDGVEHLREVARWE